MAVALKELAEKELIKHFRHKGTWLAQIPSADRWVNNDVIRLNQIGADPEVLMNNNTYPIPVVSREDDSIAISLIKFETKNTGVTDDEAYALPYDKNDSVQMQHRETLEERTEEKALHSLAPMSNTADTPVLVTTGQDDGTGRKRLTTADVIILKTKMDNLKVPKKGRMIVLCSEHSADLLHEDKDRFTQTHNVKTGSIADNFYGFQLFEAVHNPIYDSNSDKKAFGAAMIAGDANASTVIFKKNARKARGTVKRYLGKAEDNPQYRETVVGFRLYHIAIPLKQIGFAAVKSAQV